MLEVAVFEMWEKKIFINYLTRLATGLESVIFVIFAFQGVHGKHFHVIFFFRFVIIYYLPNKKNDPKMKPKMSRKWPKNGYREQP